MKTFVLFFTALISLNTVNAQFTQDFEGQESDLTGNCWIMTGIYKTSDAADVITGNGSLYTNPPTNGSSTRDLYTPGLNITSTSFTVSFNYKVSSKISGNATRTIEVGLADAAGNFTSLSMITMDKNSPTTVQSFNQNFTLASTGYRRLVLKLGGSTGDGNSRLIFDDLYASANALYGSGTCNSAPVAVNDAFSGVAGSVITGNVMTNDNEPNGEIMTASVVVVSPDGTVVLNGDGSFSFTPAPGFTGTQTTFTYHLLDNGIDPLTSNTATVTLNYFNNSTLPVKLINFDAKYTNAAVTLNWSTAQEKNFSHFVVERSTDGVAFNQTSLVFGAGESDIRMDYSYIDRNITGLSGLVYYRLVSVDTDGKIAYSSIRIIRIGANNPGIKLTTYPNPVTHELRITIPAAWQNKAVTYQLYSVNGQVVNSKQANNSSQTETMNVSNFAPGIYIVKATCGSEVAQERIVKQ